MKKFGKIINNVVTTLVALFALLIIASSLNVFGTRMFVVKSGSMEPEIHTGSVVFDRASADYGIGDIITFKVPNSKDTVTHRISEVRTDVENKIFYQVKGDANNTPDTDLVSKENVIGKVSFSIPYVGYLVAFIKTLPGLVIFIIIPATIIIYQELANVKTEIQRLRELKQTAIKTAKKVESEIIEEEKKVIAKEKKLSRFWKKQLIRIKEWMRNNLAEAERRRKENEQNS